MTYSITVPNASQSPALFPAQNNTNSLRLKDIINADHNFLDTSAADQGAHKQVTYINRTAPIGLPAGTNSILYAASVSGTSQLFFYNDAAQTYQITPINPSPTKIADSVVVSNGGSSAVVYSVPVNSQGTIFVNYTIPAGNFYRYYLFYRSSNSIVELILLNQSSNTGRPDVTVSGANDLKVTNGSSGVGSKTVSYWIIVESIP